MDVIVIIGVLATIIQTVYMAITFHTAKVSNAAGTPAPLKRRHFVIMGLLTLLAWGAFGFDYYSRANIRSGNLVVGWGGGPGNCGVSVDTTTILEFAKTYKMVGICGVHDPLVDGMEDERITISAPFTILPGVIQIISTRENKSINLPPGGPYGIWHVIALLPNNVPAEQIHKVSDVQALGGKLIGMPR
jgi:hypothetical protein